MNALMGKEWHGLENIPSDGCIVVANHVSLIDPLAVLHAVYRSGTTPHIMAKDSLFRVPVLGTLMSELQLIPVTRNARDRSRSRWTSRTASSRRAGPW